ncbi:MAG: lysophospholipid acyltransferase family protein [Fimbriimonadales bacterium]
MASRRRQLNNRLGTLAFRTALRWMRGKSVAQAESAGRRLGRIAYRLDRKHRERTIANLALAFPDESEKWHAETSVKVWEHFGLIAADFLQTPQRTNQEVLDNMTCDGLDIYRETFALGKGVLVLGAHFGNWERLGHFTAAIGIPLTAIARDANDSGLNDMVLDLRRQAGMEIVSRGNAARAVLERLKKGSMVGILPDQNAGDAFIPFFGKPAGTVLGPGVLHLRSGAPVITTYCARVGPGKYHTFIGEPLPCDGTPESVMLGMNQRLEAIIREYPEQYLWLHDRWKSARQRGLL